MSAHLLSSALCPLLALAPPGQESSRWPSQNRGVQESTAFRTWQVQDCDDAVPGLENTMREAGLSSYASAAGEWCREAGAACLQEVQEELDDLCETLGLAAPQKQQLNHAIFAFVAKGAPKHADLQVQPLLQRASSERLVWTDSSSSLKSSASRGGLARTDSWLHSSSGLVRTDSSMQTRGEDDPQASKKATRVSTEGGLRDALVGAGLESYTAAAEAWCLDMGAAFLEEILEEIDTFGEDLKLTEHQCWQLREVLDAYIANQDAYMTNMNNGAEAYYNDFNDDYMIQDSQKWTTVTTCGRNINESDWQCLDTDVHHAPLVA